MVADFPFINLIVPLPPLVSLYEKVTAGIFAQRADTVTPEPFLAELTPNHSSAKGELVASPKL